MASPCTQRRVHGDAIQGSGGWDFSVPRINFSEAVPAMIASADCVKRVAWHENMDVCTVDPEVASICHAAAKWFGDREGATFATAFPTVHDPVGLFDVLRAERYCSNLLKLARAHPDVLKPEVIWNAERGAQFTPEQIEAAHQEQRELMGRVDQFFSEYDILCTPCVMVSPFDATIRYLTSANGMTFTSYVDWFMLSYAITLTCCAAISIPCGLTATGLPVGLQIVAKDDVTALAAARLYEMSHPWKVPVEPVRGTAPFAAGLDGPRTVEDARRHLKLE
eukprot:NODE_323_length_985_cov_287.425754_g319_i0.p1 GENE.NODE_323_length_985_cov_287.425754_g319_i0~~NODE_323_length_985_cov_287.425754_g319_i0.p1  ORF type:complete len:279 (+),score=49.21 NODE_323_length_985_cov_287.425754_g319_i0:81-917(+)